jgi:AcrR family transcriptional regulator
MTQYKKDQIKERIDAAALKVFSQKGFPAAKISDISAASGISVGNIYRYYKSKDEILYSLIPEDFPPQIMKAVESKMSAARTEVNPDGERHKNAADDFFRFILENRERFLIVLSGSGGTKYEPIRSELAGRLLSTVKAIYKGKYDLFIRKYGNDETLLLIYENLISAYSQVLGLDCSEEELIIRIRQIDLYHFSGITRLLEL